MGREWVDGRAEVKLGAAQEGAMDDVYTNTVDSGVLGF
jgi:hypothetical protein